MLKLFILFLYIPLSLASAIPENSLRRPVLNKSNGDKAQFLKLISKVETIYRPYIESFGVNFTIEKDWENERVNASAFKKGSDYTLKILGGLFRFETITPDAFLLVTCHEVGHLIGGAPTYKPFNNASSEGQADYFSTAKCFRRAIRGENHSKFISKDLLSPLAIKECSLSFKESSESYNICLRTSVAIKAMAKTMKAISDIKVLPVIETPDPYERMFIIFNGYPNPQCRVDTLFAGSLCNVSEEDENDFSLKLYNKGNCSVDGGDIRGLRPKCWYVPRGEDM